MELPSAMSDETTITRKMIETMLDSIGHIGDEGVRDRLRGQVVGLAFERTEYARLASEAVQQQRQAQAQMHQTWERLQEKIAMALQNNHHVAVGDSQMIRDGVSGGGSFKQMREPVTRSLFGPFGSGKNESGSLFGPQNPGTGGSLFGQQNSGAGGSLFGTRGSDSYGRLFSDAASRGSTHRTESQSQSQSQFGANRRKPFHAGPQIPGYQSGASRNAALQDTEGAAGRRQPPKSRSSLSEATQQALQFQGAENRRNIESLGGLKGIRKFAPEFVHPAAIINDTESEAEETRNSRDMSMPPPDRPTMPTSEQSFTPHQPAAPPPSQAANQSQTQSASVYLQRPGPLTESEEIALNDANSANNPVFRRYQLRKSGQRSNPVGLLPKARRAEAPDGASPAAAALAARRRAAAVPSSQSFETTRGGQSQNQSQSEIRNQIQAQKRMQTMRSRPGRRSQEARAAMEEAAKQKYELKQNQQNRQMWSDGPAEEPSARVGRREFGA